MRNRVVRHTTTTDKATGARTSLRQTSTHGALIRETGSAFDTNVGSYALKLTANPYKGLAEATEIAEATGQTTP